MSKAATLLPQPKPSLLLTTRSFPVRITTNLARDDCFLKALAQQIRSQNRLKFFHRASDFVILQSFLKTSNGEEISLYSRSRLSAFYGAVAAEIERLTEKKTQLFLNLNASDLGSVLIFCDRLLVLSALLRNVNCFEFDAIEELRDRGETEIESALLQTYRYFEF